ncbi:hypothetical protein GGS26DRAFT_589717 [Hypomontagnella submonticulosa]|nr:hypothetical protein GGS26DRAFT_589717 [Hypomontagnella submonticulosa]
MSSSGHQGPTSDRPCWKCQCGFWNIGSENKCLCKAARPVEEPPDPGARSGRATQEILPPPAAMLDPQSAKERKQRERERLDREHSELLHRTAMECLARVIEEQGRQAREHEWRERQERERLEQEHEEQPPPPQQQHDPKSST